jgi:UDP-3-O-[3-hydroxymyristoyl] N-acetylglucosamine deacetylase/3-hydroxyacyl-[acyl-carrier-protein] dehydratase
MIDYPNSHLGTQYTAMYDLDEFEQEYAPARTFCFLSETEKLKEQGLIRGGDLDNAVVFIDRELDETEFKHLKELFGLKHKKIQRDGGILDNRKLRFVNEPVRHKVLDLLGDLALLGNPIKGHVMAARAGHASHVEIAKKVREYFETQKLTKKYQTVLQKEFVFDINAIQRIMPHRFPFLLVDRIIEMKPGEFVSGLKNVTINEPFFQGHFPEQPIMPGVLIVEAMGQVGGVLLLNSYENPDSKLVFFTGLDNVKFRKPVLPGDQLFIRVEKLYFRRNFCKIKGEVYVGDTLVAEAEMQAIVVDKNAKKTLHENQ